jgi:hypothetical protein
MSVLLVKTAEPKIESRVKPGFHRLMASACSVVLLATLLACKLTSLRLPDPLGLTIGLVFASAVVFVVTIYWHEKGKMDLRDAVLGGIAVAAISMAVARAYADRQGAKAFP